MNKRMSVSTIQPPEFINLQPDDVSPLMTKADLKVFYLGQNRNGSCITKKTATEMAKSLRGCPIVGQYIDKKEDFGDHGDQLIIDGEGARFNCLTKPFGFVSPDAKVWFQFFEDTDEFGNICMREYVMTNCYLWTGQFPEVDRVVKEHNPHSMELDDKTIKGHWATDNNSGIDFFIIDDAIFTKLCILGEDVEPCFEGSMFLEPNSTGSSFSKDSDFTKSLFTMMEELKFSLNKSNTNGEGGLSMENVQVNPENAAGTEFEATQNQDPATTSENFSSEQDNSNQSTPVENNITTEEFAKNNKDDEEEEKNNDSGEEKKPASQEDNNKDSKEAEDEEEKKKNAKNSLENEILNLQNQIADLQEKYSLLEKENQDLVAYKRNIEDKEKDELINSFYMLSDEDKADVIANKSQYSLDDIEAKLSVICVRKKVNFNSEDDKNTGNNPVVTFNLDSHQVDDTPAWLKAVDRVIQSKQ